MKVINEVICSKCLIKQVNDVDDLLLSDLFWRVCEFCNQYGLKIVVRHKSAVKEWMEALYNTMGFRVIQAEVLIKDLGKDR